MSAHPVRLVLTCEHATHSVPQEYRSLFRKDPDVLCTHRGFDQGAALLTEQLDRTFGVEPVFGQVSRLLIDLNRSAHSPNLFSRFSRVLSEQQKDEVKQRYYDPFRNEAAAKMQAIVKAGCRIVHLSVHSFTPVLDGKVRACEIGILTDPSRKSDTKLADLWTAALRQQNPGWIIRRNYPYRGISDGHVTALRKQYPDSRYTGLELEVNHALMNNANCWRKARASICDSFSQALSLL